MPVFPPLTTHARALQHIARAARPSSMAVLVTLLILPFLLSTAVAAFTPAFAVFLACGAASNVYPHDSPDRSFTTDTPFLTSPSVPAVTNANFNPAVSLLYAAARASNSAFSYKFAPPASASQFLVLRLHFFPFPAAQPTVSISSAQFAVSVLGTYTLLSSFTPPSAGVVKEFFVPAGGGSGDFSITFTPDDGLSAFVNAVELFSAPRELLWNTMASPVGAARAGDSSMSLYWQQQALETVYRLNVGGAKVNDDTLWRTWLPDDPFFDGSPRLSTVNSTSSPIVYVPSSPYTKEIAPDVVYRTQRATTAAATGTALAPGLFDMSWTFPADARADYLVRLHFCDYELVTSVVGVGVVSNVFVAGEMGTPDLDLMQNEQQPNTAFYHDYVATAPITGNLTVGIGMSAKSNPGAGGFLNGLEIMKLRPSNSSSTRSSGTDDNKKRVVIIIALSAVLGASVVAACSAVSFFVLRRRRRRIPRPAPDQDKESTQQLHIPLAEIKAATDNFHERNLIGVGGFGNVYRGVLRRDGTRVAVKRAMHATKQGLPEFRTEIAVLSAIRHRHLVSLIGYCDDQAEMILVYEHMDKGTLRSHLYGRSSPDQEPPPPLSWKQRLEICVGAARGLHYLHTGGYSAGHIIHRDVKSTNILLGDGFVAKVADFGLSRVVAGPDTHVSTAVKGTFGYLDPEYFMRQQLTDKSDVYSFGVVLFEVLCARRVIDQGLHSDQISLAQWALKWQHEGQLDKIADPRIIGQVNQDSLRRFAETAGKCLADSGTERPSMGDVLWNLEYCLQLQETHVRPEAFEDSSTTATQFPEAVVVPRWRPSSTSFLTMDEAAAATDVGVANSKVFSQLSNEEGR